MNGRLLGIGEAVTLGWETFKKQAGIVIGGYLLYVVIAAICGAIPFVNFVLILFALPPLVGGFIILILNATKDTNPTINDLFAGFNQYGKWLGVFWLFMLIMLIAYIPGGILMGIAAYLIPKGQAVTTDGSLNPSVAAMGGGAIALMVIGWIITVILVFVIMLRYMFAYYLAAEGAAPVEAFKKSEEMTRGHRGGLFWMMIVLGLVQIAGAIACGIGVFVTGPVAMLAWIHVYLAMKPQSATATGPAAPSPPPSPEPGPAPSPSPTPEPTPAPAPEPPPAPAEPAAPAEEEAKPESTEKAEE